MGDGNEISATKDPWLWKKRDFCVEQSHIYEGRNEKVASLFSPNSKQWNVNFIKERFLKEGAEAILVVPIPQRNIPDIIAWTGSSNGLYNVKDGYRFWHERSVCISNVPQNRGWGQIWRLFIPHTQNEDFYLVILSKQCSCA